ncbi:MAG: hypothetical protein Q7T81_03215 [Pseudolabrys sp.]|nr:hypothetical protein [Pseudolabrys sp.]
MSSRVATKLRGTFARGLFAAGLFMSCPLAMAQEGQQPKPQKEEPGLLESVGKWFEEQGKKVENFGHEAGIAAKTTVDGAKNAAGAVARIPAARVVDGHQKCQNAPNGAPDCVAAATAMCKAKGFESGKSADMTTADVCPAQVYLQGRNSGPGCKTETFVSRALCQ